MPVREVPLRLAGGAVLGADVLARTDLPPADTAAMDGWAVAGPGPWRIRGYVLAGDPREPLAPGLAVAIATGAWLPPGADGVLRTEHGRLVRAGQDGAHEGGDADRAGLLGLDVAAQRHVPDDEAALAVALDASTADLAVTTGSTARGPVDHLHRVLAGRAARLVVDGVAVRPGHPQLLAVRRDGRPLVGLPGNPLAAATAVLTLVVPLVDALHQAPAAPRQRVRLAEPVPAGANATRLVPVADGRPVLFAGPAMLRGLAVADGVAVVPPGGAAAGTEVELLPLPR